MSFISLKIWTFDYIKIALLVSIISGLISGICLGYVAWENGNSRNLALGAGTLAGAALLMGVQLLFELRRPAVTKDVFSVEYTIDRAVPSIRQWAYSRSSSWRADAEINAGKYLGKNYPNLFNKNREKLTNDMAIFSIVAFLFWNQQDWQLKRAIYKGKTVGNLTTTAFGSKSEECTPITQDLVIKKLHAAGNSFASSGQYLPNWHLCLPPNSTMVISSDGLILENPFCKISFTLQSAGWVSNIKPETQYSPLLPNGDSRYETRVINIKANVTYFALRAQNVEMPKYQSWATRTLDGLRNWFEDTDQ